MQILFTAPFDPDIVARSVHNQLSPLHKFNKRNQVMPSDLSTFKGHQIQQPKSLQRRRCWNSPYVCVYCPYPCIFRIPSGIDHSREDICRCSFRIFPGVGGVA